MTYPIESDKVSGSGTYLRGLAGEALGNRKVVYISDDGTWKLADADAAATLPSFGLTMHTIESGKYGWILTNGFIGLLTWTWTQGGKLYLSEGAAGELTQTAPSGVTAFIQELGTAQTSTQIAFCPRLVTPVGGGTYTKHIHLTAAAFKLPAAGSPDVAVQDNTVMLSFNQNDSEDAYMAWETPEDYAGGDLDIMIHWTNDGGGDDNGKNVRWEINYQTVVSPGGSIAGDHANSPKVVNDTYSSATGHLEHTTGMATIAAADFATAHHVHIRLTALVAAATQLTGESQFLEMMLAYTAYSTPT